MAEAFVKLYKKMLEWEWYDDNNTKIVFLHCLLKANWKACKWHGMDIKPGQFITSYPSLAEETCLSVHQVRVALDHLKMTGEVAVKRQSKCSVITVNNWNEYQGSGSHSGSQVSVKRQSSGSQVATDKEYKEIKEEEELKELKNKYYPNDDNLDKAFSEYVDYRKKIKKPLTDRGIDLNIARLDKLSGGNNDTAIRIIEQSIMQGWQGLFELKEDRKAQSQSVADQWLNA